MSAQLDLTLDQMERLKSALNVEEIDRTIQETEIHAAETAATALLMSKLCVQGRNIYPTHDYLYRAADRTHTCRRCNASAPAINLRPSG